MFPKEACAPPPPPMALMLFRTFIAVFKVMMKETKAEIEPKVTNIKLTDPVLMNLAKPGADSSNGLYGISSSIKPNVANAPAITCEASKADWDLLMTGTHVRSTVFSDGSTLKPNVLFGRGSPARPVLFTGTPIERPTESRRRASLVFAHFV